MQRGASLGDILIEKGFVKQAQLDDAKRWQKTHPNEKISAILLSRGIITEDAMLSAMAERFNTTYINPTSIRVTIFTSSNAPMSCGSCVAIIICPAFTSSGIMQCFLTICSGTFFRISGRRTTSSVFI